MLRATLLLTILPALALAAAAPFPRERRDPDARGWSKPVDGLRVRLVAQRTRYQLGETVRLTLEIQNVGNSVLMLEDPRLHHTLSPAAPRGWAITGERTAKSGQEEKRQHKQLEKLRWRSDVVRLWGGEILRIEIHADTGMKEQKMEKLLEESEARREDLFFPDADTPGVYDLRVTFRRGARTGTSALKKGWSGNALTSPPVRIELHE